ncbi:MAG: S-methyl-5'-thioadenosine phosphorylase [Thermomicrobiales bacterium]|nr:S-methyl-5'-thioadenosine phosphorylase [Thermomicrobiales bacterium]
MLGVIGGSGIYNLPDLADVETVEPKTPYGTPSGPVRVGRIGETRIAFIPRHGPGHRFSPTNLPYRANIYALKELGVTHLLSISAVGSMKESLPPRSLVLPDQIIDRTVDRPRTFFDRGIVAHVGLADPYCALLRQQTARAAVAAGNHMNVGGTYICIEGPQFSTRAESNLYRSWGATVIGMTAMPEARLAREAELCYATLALVTDYDVWHETEEDVSVDVVLGHLRANSAAAAGLVRELARLGMPERSCHCGDALAGAIITDPAVMTAAERAEIAVLAGRHLERGDE